MGRRVSAVTSQPHCHRAKVPTNKVSRWARLSLSRWTALTRTGAACSFLIRACRDHHVLSFTAEPRGAPRLFVPSLVLGEVDDVFSYSDWFVSLSSSALQVCEILPRIVFHRIRRYLFSCFSPKDIYLEPAAFLHRLGGESFLAFLSCFGSPALWIPCGLFLVYMLVWVSMSSLVPSWERTGGRCFETLNVENAFTLHRIDSLAGYRIVDWILFSCWIWKMSLHWLLPSNVMRSPVPFVGNLLWKLLVLFLFQMVSPFMGRDSWWIGFILETCSLLQIYWFLKRVSSYF